MTKRGTSRIDSAKAAREIAVREGQHGYAGGWLVAQLVDDPAEPEVVADFVATLLLSPDGRKLTPRRRARAAEAPNAYWLVFGPIVEASDGSLVLGEFTFAPAWKPRDGDDVFRGVTAPLLRLVSPATLLTQAVEYLRRSASVWGPVSARQRRAQARLEQGRVPRTRVGDDEIERLARHYITLYRQGLRRGLLPKLADDFGLTREQARDRIHRARLDGFLRPTTRGQIDATPGPRLPESTLWQPRPTKGDTSG